MAKVQQQYLILEFEVSDQCYFYCSDFKGALS